MFQFLAWIVLGAAFLLTFTSWRLLLKRQNHLADLVGILLLSDELRTDHKRAFEDWLRASNETNAADLSCKAALTLARVADSIATHDPNRTSSVLIFHSLVWNRRKELSQDSVVFAPTPQHA
jgi:hypothetical protein